MALQLESCRRPHYCTAADLPQPCSSLALRALIAMCLNVLISNNLQYKEVCVKWVQCVVRGRASVGPVRLARGPWERGHDANKPPTQLTPGPHRRRSEKAPREIHRPIPKHHPLKKPQCWSHAHRPSSCHDPAIHAWAPVPAPTLVGRTWLELGILY